MDKLFENCDFTVVLNVFVCNLLYVRVHVCVYTAFCVCVFLVVSYVSSFAALDAK